MAWKPLEIQGGKNMVVQHNLRAMNSNRMLGITSSTQSKSTEKLSSGYKINRAADDAAGLAISEKMRKQVRGLTKAVSNAQDVYYLTNNAYAKNFENIDVEVKDKNIKCYVSSGRWISCYTKNYALVHYYALDSLANQTECYATHEKFIKACEDFLKFNSTPNNNAVCDMLGVNPCFSVIKKMGK